MPQTSDFILLLAMLLALTIFAVFNWIGMEKILPKLHLGEDRAKPSPKKDETQKTSYSPDDKKRRFLEMRGIIIHYINETKLRQFYSSQFNDDMILESLTDETTKELQGNVGAGVKGVVETNAESKVTRKQTSSLKPKSEEVHAMFLKYQRANIENGTVTLGLEDIESAELDKLPDEIRQKYSVTLPENFLAQLAEKAAEKIIEKIETAQRWVLIEGDFEIQRDGEHYKCTHKHQVNKYIANSAHHITLSFTVPSKELAPEITHYYEKNPTMRLAVYGYILQYINSEKGIWDLQLVPLAVY